MQKVNIDDKLLHSIDQTKRGLEFNDKIVDGFSNDEINIKAIDFIDTVLKAAFSKSVTDIKYAGYRKLQPHEQYDLMVNRDKVTGKIKSKKDNNIQFTSVVTYEFTFVSEEHGEFKKYINMMASDKNVISMYGVKYIVIPIITDPVISAMVSHLFIRLIKNKVKVYAQPMTFIITSKDIESMIKTYPIVYMELNNNKSNRMSEYAKVINPMVIYLLKEYGLSGMKELYNVDIEIIKNGDGKKAEELLNKGYYEIKDANGNPNIKFKVDKPPYRYFIKDLDHEVSRHTITSIIYLATVFPKDAIRAFTHIENKEEDEELTAWKILLGKAYLTLDISNVDLLREVDNHLKKADGYIDDVIIRLFSNIADIRSLEDMVYHVLSNYSKYASKGKTSSYNLRDSYYDVNYYIYYNIIENINKMVSKLDVEYGKNSLNPKTINAILSEHIKINQIINVTKSKSPSIAVQLYDETHDNRLFKSALIADKQSNGVGVTRPSKKSKENLNPIPYSNKDAIRALAGNLWYLKKNDPDGDLKMNPFVKFKGEFNYLDVSKEDEQIIEKCNRIVNVSSPETVIDNPDVLDASEDIKID